MDGTVRVKSLVWFATGVVVTLLATVIVMQTWRVDAAPGDGDTTFVQVTPGCRFADTRQPGQGGPIGPGQTRTFAAHGTNNACTIPSDAVGLVMNVTADGQTAANSFLTIWGNGPNPGTSALNPAAGEPPTPNAVTTDLTATGAFNVYNDAGSVNVIIDVAGYYVETAQAFAVTNATALTSAIILMQSPIEVVSVAVTAPVAGQVTVNSTAYVSHPVDQGAIICAIFEDFIPAGGGAFIPIGTPSYQKWVTGLPSAEGSLAGTRTFDIAAGATITYSLACQTQDELNEGRFFGGNLTAIFTPAP